MGWIREERDRREVLSGPALSFVVAHSLTSAECEEWRLVCETEAGTTFVDDMSPKLREDVAVVLAEYSVKD